VRADGPRATCPKLSRSALTRHKGATAVNDIPAQISKRKAAIGTSCPTCGALSSFCCFGARGQPRLAIHRDRYAKARGEIPA